MIFNLFSITPRPRGKNAYFTEGEEQGFAWQYLIDGQQVIYSKENFKQSTMEQGWLNDRV